MRQHARTILMNACLAMIIYGGWAFYANYDHSMGAGWRAGVIQAVYAFISTCSVAAVAQFLYQKSGCGKIGWCVGFSGSFLLMISIPLLIHHFAGTPDILETIAPGIVIGSIYIAGFLNHCRMKNRRAYAENESSL